VGLLDFLRNPGGKARGWDALPAAAPEPERKLWTYPYGYPAITFPYGMLIHGPGASDLLSGSWGADANSAVFACLMALSMAFFEAPLKVAKLDPDGKRAWLPDHPMQDLLDNPNPAMNQQELWFWVCWALHTDGNAYLQKVRSGNPLTGNPVQLWPRSPRLVEPKTVSAGDFISYYRRDLGQGHFEDVPPENMVHVRLGIDERDHRVGIAPLKRLVRQIATDDQAAAFEDRLLRNFAVPGTVIHVPEGVQMTKDAAEALKANIHAAYSGENQGYTGVLTGGAKLDRVSFSPNEMALDAIHKYLESRITAVLRVPPAVVNLMVGLEQTSNYASARILFEGFTERTLIPLWSMVSAKVNQQLTPNFTADRTVRAEFDLSDVRSLQEDETARYTRISMAVEKGWMLRNEARAEIGLPPVDGWDDQDTAPPPAPVITDDQPPDDEEDTADDEARLRLIDVRTVEPVLPAGAGDPLEVLPLAPEVTPVRLRRMARLWDAEFRGTPYSGLLDAEVADG
jgi:HK97 family phage portal protein